MKFAVKYRRIFAIAVAVAVIITTLVFTTGGFDIRPAKAISDLTSDEKKIVDDISNLTGAPAEEILRLRVRGKSWNQILEELKGRNFGDSESRKKRNDTLAGNGLDEETIKSLQSQGFTEEEITEAKMFVERVVFQLNEIVGDTESDLNPAAPEVGVGTGEDGKKDIEEYKKLAEKVEINVAVPLLLKLKKELGTFESVMDEYLYALQVEIDPEDAVKDKEKYEKEKREKGVILDIQKRITVSKIETKMLEKVQKDNAKNMNKPLNESSMNQVSDGVKIQDVSPKAPLPEVMDTKPKNPADEINKEIDDIKNRSFGIEGGQTK